MERGTVRTGFPAGKPGNRPLRTAAMGFIALLMAGDSLPGEQPAGLGFGAAAVALSSAFQVTAWTAEGLPTIGGKIRVPIRYEAPETEAQP